MSDQEIAEIESAMQTDNGEYWHSPQMQERYRDLLDARDSGAATPPGNANLTRRAEIEKSMASAGNSSEYWHSPEMQAEYMKLLDTPPPAHEGGRDDATSPEIAETQERVNTAFQGIDTTDLDASFMGMSDAAQSWAGRVLQDPSTRIAAIEQMIPF